MLQVQIDHVVIVVSLNILLVYVIKSMNILLQEMVKAKEHKVNKFIIPRYVVIVVRMDTLLMIVTKNVNILPYTNSIIIKKPQSIAL